MSKPVDALFLIDVMALMLARVLQPPCRYPAHLPWLWINQGGQPVCGVCHPPAEEQR